MTRFEVLALPLLFAGPALAQPPQAPPVRPEYVRAEPPQCPTCRTMPVAADAFAPSMRAEALPTDAFGDLYRQAVAEKRPLLVWVNYNCKSSSDRLPEYLHYHTKEFRSIKSPSVVALVPDGKGGLYRGSADEVIAADNCCATSLRDAVEATYNVLHNDTQFVDHNHGQAAPQAPPMRLQMMPAPMTMAPPMMMGGGMGYGGGGMMRGGYGSGGGMVAARNGPVRRLLGGLFRRGGGGGGGACAGGG